MAFYEDLNDDDLMMGRRRPRAPAAPVNPTPTNPLIRTPPYLPPTRPIAQTTPYPLPIPRQPTETDENGMEMPARMPGPQAPQGVPGGGFPSGPIAPTAAAGPSNRAQEYGMAQMASENATPKGFKGRLLSGLRAGLGGRGFISGFADPRAEQQAQFMTREAPQIGQRWQLEDQERARKAAEAQATQEALYRQSQIAENESQNKQREEAAKLAREQFEYEKTKPLIVPPDSAVLPRGANTPTFIAPPRTREPKQPTQLDFQTERDRVTEEWGDPRAVATSSTDNRRESIIDTLPDQYRSILRTGQTLDKQPAGATKLRLAQEAFEKARQRDIEQGTKLDTQKREAEARRRLGERRPTTGPQRPQQPSSNSLPITTGHGTAAPVRRMNINAAQERYKGVDLRP